MRFAALFPALLLVGTVNADDTNDCECGNGKAKLWGPGGPHTALIPAAEIFNQQQARTGDQVYTKRRRGIRTYRINP